MDSQAAKGLDLYKKFLVADDAGKTKEARECLRKSARLGEPMAYHVLAYREFAKRKPRIEWALRYYRAAARAGFAPSAWNLAKTYEDKGRTDLFIKWMRVAAKIGDPDARAELRRVGATLRG